MCTQGARYLHVHPTLRTSVGFSFFVALIFILFIAVSQYYLNTSLMCLSIYLFIYILIYSLI